MDKICIDGLEIFANHGILEAEKILGQKFLVSAELEIDLRNAGTTDNMHQTVSYAEVCVGITKVVKEETFSLIETCAEKISAYILQNYPPIQSVLVTVEKPWAPIKQSVRNISVQIFRKRSKIYLGLGSNMGDKKAALDSAIEKLALELTILKCSSYYTTNPISHIPQDDYLNCVLEAETTLNPLELIGYVMQIESSMGRKRTVRWGPRVIDIDVLAYDNIVSDHSEIILPHPLMHERIFVLAPFCEVNPHYVHPLLKRRVADLKLELEKIQSKNS